MEALKPDPSGPLRSDLPWLRRFAGRAGAWWVAALAAALAYVAVDTAARIRHLLALEHLSGVQVAAPAPDAGSADRL